MSDQPLSKRQKRGDGSRALALALALGGPMYDEATARKILKEVVLVDAEDAEDGVAVIGFDPDDEALDDLYYIRSGELAGRDVTPMIYFADKGDAKMCRYLASRGASTTKSSSIFGPMYIAAQQGHLEVCKFLQANGASRAIWEEMTLTGWAPFHTAAVNSRDEVVRWLVLQGALCANSSTETVEGHRIYPNRDHGNDVEDWLYQMQQHQEQKISRSCERLVEWAKEVTESHSSLMMFLLGALPPAPGKDQSRTLQCLSGHPGVRKHIGNFVGLEVKKGKHLRILRNVVDVLPSLIKD